MKRRFVGAAAALLLAALLSACCANHEWVAATCTTPKTCSKCEATEGDVLEHKWDAATCVTAKKCSLCDETSGDALGHNWQEATCDRPQTCSVCHEVSGEALGHTWEDATCTTAKTCSRCKLTEGDKLSHSWGDWEITKEATPTESGNRSRACKECGETDNEQFEMEVLIKDGLFVMTPNEMGTRLADKLVCQSAQMYYNMNGLYCGLKGIGKIGKYDTGYEEDEPIAIVQFVSKNSIMGIDEKDSTSMKSLSVKFLTTDSDKIVDSMLGLLMACDGSLDDSAARKVGKEIIAAFQNGSINHQHNGINYVFTQKSDYYLFVISVV